MEQTRKRSDLGMFLGQLVRKPTQVVALAPSSEELARQMALRVPAGTGPVVELGPGTGKITQALLDVGIAAGDLHMLELNPDFVAHLKQAFPGTHVHHRSACEIDALGLDHIRAVVSGLPFLSMPNSVQRDILEGAFAAMPPGGVFIQFTYGPTAPVAEELRTDLDLIWDKSDRVWGNLPPARVYTFRQVNRD